MSKPTNGEVIEYVGRKLPEMYLFGILRASANADNEVTISYSVLSELARLHYFTVRNVIKRLIADKVIEIAVPYSAETNSPPTYRILQ